MNARVVHGPTHTQHPKEFMSNIYIIICIYIYCYKVFDAIAIRAHSMGPVRMSAEYVQDAADVARSFFLN